jgi:putative ABC transport system permease protein
MKKFCVCILCFLTAALVGVRMVQVSNESILRFGNLEKDQGMSFSIPDSDAICDPDTLFTILSATARETSSSIIRTSLTEGTGRDSYVINKYILLPDDGTEYAGAFPVHSGRFLTAAETLAPDSRAFVSTKDTGEADQTGTIRAHILRMEMNVYPYGRIFGSLKADGLYFAFPGEGVSENAFLEALQGNITRYSGVQVELSELKGTESKVGMPTRDLTSEFLVLGMAFLLFVLLVFYYLLRGKRKIAVMRLMGAGTGRIWWEMFRTLVIAQPAVLLVLSAVILSGGRDGLYTAEVMLPAYILFPVCLLFYTGAFAVTSGSGIYVHALKGRDYTGGILVIQIIAECAALAAMIYCMSGAYNCAKELGRNAREYQTWTAAGDYGVFYPMYTGDEQTGEEETRREAVIASELYPYLDAAGMVYVNAHAFEDRSEWEGSQTSDAEKAGDRTRAEYTRSLEVNPNYLDIFPVLDASGAPVHVSRDESALILLVPDTMRDAEAEVRDWYENDQLACRENDAQVYGVLPDIPEKQDVRIIWAAPGQKVFTFDPDVNDTGMIDMPVMEVLTERNSYITQRQILGTGNTDPAKIRLKDSTEAAYRQTLPVLEELGLADNFKALVSVNERAEAQLAVTRDGLRLALISMAVFLAMAFYLIYQTTALVFDRNKRRYLVEAVFGVSWQRMYRTYLISETMIPAVLCLLIALFDRYSDRLFLLVVCILLVTGQGAFIFGCTVRLQKKNMASVLKGE